VKSKNSHAKSQLISKEKYKFILKITIKDIMTSLLNETIESKIEQGLWDEWLESYNVVAELLMGAAESEFEEVFWRTELAEHMWHTFVSMQCAVNRGNLQRINYMERVFVNDKLEFNGVYSGSKYAQDAEAFLKKFEKYFDCVTIYVKRMTKK
jgi:hypothetical protein